MIRHEYERRRLDVDVLVGDVALHQGELSGHDGNVATGRVADFLPRLHTMLQGEHDE